MTTTNIVQLTTALIITTILIVGFGVVEVGAQEAGATSEGGIKILGVGIIEFIGAVALTITAVVSVLSFFKNKKGFSDVKKQLNTYIKTHKGEHEEHENRHEDIYGLVLDKINNLGKSNSPRQLNDRGKALFKNSGAEDYLTEHITELCKSFEGINEAWRIDEKSPRVIVDNKDAVALEPVKKWAYENGEDYNDILAAMSIELRNMVLDKKGIQIKEPEKQETRTNKQ